MYMVVIAQLAEHRIVVPSVVGSSPTLHPQTSFGMSFCCIVACTLRYLLSVSSFVSVSELPIRPYYPIKSWQISHYSKKSVDARALKPRFLLVSLAAICAPRRASSVIMLIQRQFCFPYNLVNSWLYFLKRDLICQCTNSIQTDRLVITALFVNQFSFYNIKLPMLKI